MHLRCDIYDPLCGFEFGQLAEFGNAVFCYDRYYIGVSLESGAFCSQTVGADQVERLALELGSRILYEILSFHGETADYLIVSSYLSDISEYVSCALQLDHHLAVLLLDLLIGNCERGLVRNCSCLEYHVGGLCMLHYSIVHLL